MFRLARYVPPAGFFALSAVFFSRGLPNIFQPGSARGVSPFRAFSSRRSRRASSTRPCPLAVAAAWLPCFRTAAIQTVAHLQGFDPLPESATTRRRV